MKDAKLCLIDAHSLFYRAFYAIKAPLITSSGQPTNAVFGFVKMVRRILEEVRPEYLGVCFDVAKKTHRTEKFAEYKIHRAPMPSELLSQVPFIKEVVAAYNFAAFEAPGYEADDVIASIVHRFSGKVGKTVLVSSDKDILQLVSDRVEVYNPYKEDGIVFTAKVVKEKFGVPPQGIPDLISLMGDASDNIPGAKGIGEKTARALLEEFKSVDEILSHPDRIKREAVRKIIEQSAPMILLSKELAQLHRDVPLECRLEDLERRQTDSQKLWEVFSRLEFKGLLQEISRQRLSATRPALDIAVQPLSDVKEFFKKADPGAPFAFYVSEAVPGPGLAVNAAIGEDEVFEVSARAARDLWSQPDRLAVGHDVKKSLRLLRREGIEVRSRFFDTMIAAHLAESSRASRDLEGLLWDHLGLEGVSRLDYQGRESHYLWRLRSRLEEALQERGLRKLFEEVEMPLVDVLAEMEGAGVRVDVSHLQAFSREMDKKLDGLVKEIHGAAGGAFNINSPKQLGEVLFGKLKLPILKKTKTGASTDEEVLTRLAADHPLPQRLLEYRQIAKLKTTYIDALPQLVDAKTGRIHSSFNQTGTETGRLSSSNPNLQNIPIKTELGRRIRQAFVPGDGYDCLLSADYSQIELRILAHLSQDETLLRAFREDADVHRYTASLIFGVKEDEVSGGMRENAKRVNFGIVYGMSAFGLAKDLGIDPGTAQTFIDEYFLRYPKVRGYLEDQVAFVRENGFVATLLGRRRYIPEIRNANAAVRQFAERQAVNAPIQGSAADIIKLAMLAIHRGLREQGLRSRLILQVHDELVFEVKKSERPALIKLVREGMEGVMPLRVPLKTTISVGKNWLETEEVPL